jgi:hypothetical protein
LATLSSLSPVIGKAAATFRGTLKLLIVWVLAKAGILAEKKPTVTIPNKGTIVLDIDISFVLFYFVKNWLMVINGKGADSGVEIENPTVL